jgi:predicted nuclease of predicted toxin-antitoxin system
VRLLCDHNVNEKYIDTFQRTEGLTVATVRDELSQDADDAPISEYAEQHGWVVFTEDDHFHAHDHDRGVIFYTHIENPSPGDVVTAIQEIADEYDDHRSINEHVPDGWIDRYQ